jgi:hypothetical protein
MVKAFRKGPLAEHHGVLIAVYDQDYAESSPDVELLGGGQPAVPRHRHRASHRRLRDPAKILDRDVGSDDMPEAERRYKERASAQFNARDRDRVSRFFDGLVLTAPGLVNLSRWSQGTTGDDREHADIAAYCGIARKP